ATLEQLSEEPGELVALGRGPHVPYAFEGGGRRSPDVGDVCHETLDASNLLQRLGPGAGSFRTTLTWPKNARRCSVASPAETGVPARRRHMPARPAASKPRVLRARCMLSNIGGLVVQVIQTIKLTFTDFYKG